MRSICWFLLWALGSAVAGSQTIPFQRLGHPLNIHTNVTIVWDAPTNGLPNALWIYRAVKPQLSPSVVSNLIHLGSFTGEDRQNVHGYPRFISYAKPDGKASFRINPDWIWIEYNDPDANDMHITEGVPTPEKAFQIATNWLPQLNIDRSELATTPHTHDLQRRITEATTILYKKSNGQAYATNIHMREVSFMRSLDGVQISGGCARGGCSIQIGHHAKIAQIFVSWRTYRHDKSYPVASPALLVKWIQDNKAVWWCRGDDPAPVWASAKKVTIKEVTPYYYSEGYSEFDKPLDWAAPFAEFEATVETASTKSVVFIDSPIIDAGMGGLSGGVR